VIVEVLDRRGAVMSRTRLESLPASVGRGYGSDVILDDPFVDAAHARITAGPDGMFVVEDLGSLNGLWEGQRRVGQCTLRPGGSFRLGRTLLRLATADLPVPPAAADRELALAGWRALVAAPGVVVLLTALGAVVFGYLIWVAEVDGSKAGETAGGTIGLVLLVVAWAACWAAGARLARHRPQFLRHLGVAWLGVLAVTALSHLVGLAGFAFPGSAMVAAAGWAVGVVPVVWLIHVHLELASAMGAARRLAWASGVTGALVALGLLFGSIDSGGSRGIEAGIEIRGVPLSLVPAGSVEEFLEHATLLQEKVDRAAEKAAAAAASRR
jgi:hypothetical protein